MALNRKPAAEQTVLFPDTTITVHCIFCPHTERADDPDRVHAAMEAHYDARHADAIAKIIAGLR